MQICSSGLCGWFFAVFDEHEVATQRSIELLRATRLNKLWYSDLTRGVRGPLSLGGKFSIRPNFYANMRKTNRYD